LLARNKVICNYLESLNRGFNAWDETFTSQGKKAAEEVLAYCHAYGVQVPGPMKKGAAQCAWDWSKFPHEYTTMNDWFTRQYRPAMDPALQNNQGGSFVLAPATAVVTFFPSLREMPSMLKNDAFHINNCGRCVWSYARM
jgi:hypothetical protein